MFEKVKNTLKSEEFKNAARKVAINVAIGIGTTLIVHAAVAVVENAIDKAFEAEVPSDELEIG